MRRVLLFLFSFLLLVPNLEIPIRAETDSYLESVDLEVNVLSDEQFARPFEGTLQTLNTAFGIMEGFPVSYTVATGAGNLPAVFNVVNLETGELMYYESMDGAIRAWDLVVNDLGDVYIGASGSTAQLWKFDPKMKKLEKLGEPIDGMDTIFTLATDGMRVFGGGYPTGKAFEYSPITGEFKDLGIIDEGHREEFIEDISPESYIRSSAVYKDHVYLGSGSKNGRIIKVDISSGKYEKELIEMPVTEENKAYYENMQFVYDLRVVDNYLFAFFNGPFAIHIYDLEAEKWLDVNINNVRGLVGASTKYQDHIYFSSKDKNMYRFDLNTLELDPNPYSKFDANLRNTEVIELNGKEQMVSIHFNGSYFFMDFTGSEPVILQKESPAIGQSINVHSLHIDEIHQKMYASGFMGTELFEANLQNNMIKKMKLGQLEGMTSDGEYIYFGEYPGAQIFRYPLNGEGEIEKLFTLREYHQDRPFKMVIDQDKLFIGTIADYGQLQGALTIYDLKTGELKVHDNLAKDQGIVGIAVNGDYAYLSTTTRGGIGSIPTQKHASVIKFNWKEGKIENSKTYAEEFFGENVPMISGLIFDDNHRLWAFANGTVFEIMPDDLSMGNRNKMYIDIDNFGNWRPVHSYIHNGLIYANPGFNMTVIHPETLDFEFLGRSAVFSVDALGNIYYMSGVDINKLSLKVNVKENWVKEPVNDENLHDDKPGEKQEKTEKGDDADIDFDKIEDNKDNSTLIADTIEDNNKIMKVTGNKETTLPATGKMNLLGASVILTSLGYILFKKQNR